VKTSFAGILLCAGAVVVCQATALHAQGQPAPSTTGPQYNKQGELLRPGDFRTWVFVGANIGLQYKKELADTAPKEKEGAKGPIGDFHNVYINPEAYEQYLKTGKFSDGTMLIMDVYEAKERDPQDIVAKGLYPGQHKQIEVAVKNSKRPDGSKTDWAYYVFPQGRASAKAAADAACYQCHKQHAQVDNVWVQFYPTLRPAKGATPEPRTDALGDPLPERALVRIGTARLHGGGGGVAMSKDGRFLASCSGQGLTVWDGRDGKPLWRFELPQWGPWAFAISPDGKELAAVSRSFESQPAQTDFYRWELATGRVLQKDKNHPGTFESTCVSVALAARPDGAYLVAQTGVATISLHEQGNPKSARMLKGHVGRVMSVAFLHEGQTLVSLAEDGTIRFWNVADGKETAKVPVPSMKGHSLEGNLATIAASADGKHLAVLLPDRSTRLLDAAGKELRRLPNVEDRDALAFSADGKSLLTGGSWVQLWDVVTGQETPILSEPRLPIHYPALSRDGKTVAFAQGLNRVCLADMATGKKLFAASGSCKAGIAFAPDGKHLAVAGGETTIGFWDVADLRALEKVFPAKPAAVLACQGKVAAFAFSPDGKRLATAEEGGMVRIYDTASKQVLRAHSVADSVFAVGFSPDGKLLATMGSGWPVSLPAGPRQRTRQVVRLWDIVSGKEVAVPKEVHSTGHTAAFHPGTKTLMVLHLAPLARYTIYQGQLPPVEEFMEAVRLWDLASMRQRLRFEDPAYRAMVEQSRADLSAMFWTSSRESAEPCAFSPDGHVFAVPGVGGIVLFETASGKVRLRLGGQGGVTGLAFTPDGKTLVAASADATVLVWDVTGLRTVGKLPGKVEELWLLLADADPERAGAAVWTMMDAPLESLKLLRKYLQRVPANQDGVRQLIADLDDPQYAVRDKATRELALLGPAAEDALTAKMRTKVSLEMSKRIEKLLAAIASTPPTPEQLRIVRAVEVLEGIGTPEVRELLEDLASGAEGAWLTIQAREALARLKR
jgi:WD40 repeat protein